MHKSKLVSCNQLPNTSASFIVLYHSSSTYRKAGIYNRVYAQNPTFRCDMTVKILVELDELEPMNRFMYMLPCPNLALNVEEEAV